MTEPIEVLASSYTGQSDNQTTRYGRAFYLADGSRFLIHYEADAPTDLAEDSQAGQLFLLCERLIGGLVTDLNQLADSTTDIPSRPDQRFSIQYTGDEFVFRRARTTRLSDLVAKQRQLMQAHNRLIKRIRDLAADFWRTDLEDPNPDD